MAVNLLPWREERYVRKLKLFSITLLIGLSLAVMILGMMKMVLVQKKKNLQQNQALLLKKIQQVKEKQAQQAAELLQSQKKQGQRNCILTISKKEEVLRLLLESLGEIPFKTVYLTHLIFEKNQLQLKGMARSVLSLSQFMNALKKLPMARDVKFSGAETIESQPPSQENAIAFSLEVNLKAGQDVPLF